MELSIVIPVRNGVLNSTPLVQEVGAALDGRLVHEVRSLDGGSAGGTAPTPAARPIIARRRSRSGALRDQSAVDTVSATKLSTVNPAGYLPTPPPPRNGTQPLLGFDLKEDAEVYNYWGQIVVHDENPGWLDGNAEMRSVIR